MGLLSRKDLLQKEKLEIEKVEFDDNDYVFVRQMTGHERDAWEQSLLIKSKDRTGKVTYEQSTEDFRAKLAVVTVCDDQGNLLFIPGDHPTLSRNMSAKRLEKIINVAQKLNAITEEDRENLVKNSEAVPDGNSNSDSVEN